MTHHQAITVICRYVIKPGKSQDMERLLARHWTTLHELGLTTDTEPLIYRGLASNDAGGTHGAANTYVEIFEWKDASAPQTAHQTPEVMAVWEPMGALCTEMDFPHYVPLALRASE